MPRHLVPEQTLFQSVFPLLFMVQTQNRTNGPGGAAPWHMLLTTGEEK